MAHHHDATHPAGQVGSVTTGKELGVAGQRVASLAGQGGGLSQQGPAQEVGELDRERPEPRVREVPGHDEPQVLGRESLLVAAASPVAVVTQVLGRGVPSGRGLPDQVNLPTGPCGRERARGRDRERGRGRGRNRSWGRGQG